MAGSRRRTTAGLFHPDHGALHDRRSSAVGRRSPAATPTDSGTFTPTLAQEAASRWLGLGVEGGESANDALVAGPGCSSRCSRGRQRGLGLENDLEPDLRPMSAGACRRG